MNKWSELLRVPYPECKRTGQCCRFSSPSTPGIGLLQKAAQGDEFSRDYLSIFIPYLTINEVKKLNPALVNKNLEAVETSKCKDINTDNMTFYYCRYLTVDNNCLIYEDRPALCRDFPDSPFLVLAPDCAYGEWATLCKEKYKQLKLEIQQSKEELKNLKYQLKVLRLFEQLQRINNDEYKLPLLLPSLSLISPGTSWIKIY